MAYMRGVPYIYSDGEHLQIRNGGRDLTVEQAEELAAMIWHRLSEDEQAAVMQRVVVKHGGNFGADGVMQALGLPTVMEQVLLAEADEADK